MVIILPCHLLTLIIHMSVCSLLHSCFICPYNTGIILSIICCQTVFISSTYYQNVITLFHLLSIIVLIKFSVNHFCFCQICVSAAPLNNNKLFQIIIQYVTAADKFVFTIHSMYHTFIKLASIQLNQDVVRELSIHLWKIRYFSPHSNNLNTSICLVLK